MHDGTLFSRVEMKSGKNIPRSTAKWRWIDRRRIFMRSRWEFNYALYLQDRLTKKEITGWDYEPETFWFFKILRGVRSYKPDFCIYNIDGSHEWVEVKGYLDARSRTKLKRFAKYYPQEKMTVIDRKWFKESEPVYKKIRRWELIFKEKKNKTK